MPAQRGKGCRTKSRRSVVAPLRLAASKTSSKSSAVNPSVLADAFTPRTCKPINITFALNLF